MGAGRVCASGITYHVDQSIGVSEVTGQTLAARLQCAFALPDLENNPPL